MAVVAPVVLLLIFFSIQLALWLYGRNVAMQSAREGVCYLRVIADGSETSSALAAAEVTTENYARQVGRETVLDVDATATATPDTDRVAITVVGRSISLVPGVTFRVRGHAEGQIERFDPDLEP